MSGIGKSATFCCDEIARSARSKEENEMIWVKMETMVQGGDGEWKRKRGEMDVYTKNFVAWDGDLKAWVMFDAQSGIALGVKLTLKEAKSKGNWEKVEEKRKKIGREEREKERKVRIAMGMGDVGEKMEEILKKAGSGGR